MIKEKITFQTITPVFTGNIEQQMTEIKPASIMGSLKFWFEVLCHFSGKFKNKENKEKKYGNELKYKEYIDFLRKNPNASEKGIWEEIKLSPTAYYFGCTGWKSKIGIESIEYNFVTKEKNNTRIIKGKNWHFPKQYYEGEFSIDFIFKNEDIKKNILYPLLNFIQEYGFLGGKNNIGFGRVKIIKTETNQEIFKDSKVFKIKLKNKSDELEEVKKFEYIIEKIKGEQLFQYDNIGFFNYENEKNKYIDQIKELLETKAILRLEKKNDKNERHYVFGSNAKDKFNHKNSKQKSTKGPNATKIIPLIRENDYGFLVIPGIINMEETCNVQ